MSSFELMTPILCHVIACPPLQESNEKRVGKISSTSNETSYPIIEDILDGVSSCDQDIDQMVEVLSDQYMEQIKKYQGIIQTLEVVKEGPLL